MLLLFLSLFRLTISKFHHVCVCHPSQCDYTCQNSNIEGNFEIVGPNDFEKFIIDKFYSSHQLHRKFDVYVTFNDIPIQFNLSSFDYLQISFRKYFDFTNISDISSKIRVKIRNDINTSSAQLTFSQSNVVVSDPFFQFFSKSILNLGSLKMQDNSTLDFENGGNSAILNSKCCSLNDFGLMTFDEIYVENGFCSEDFSLESSTIQTLYFNQYNYSKFNYFLIINNNVKIYNALKLKVESNNNNNLIISAKSNTPNAHLAIIPQLFLKSFDQIYFENDSILESIDFTIKNTRSIICKTKYLLANFDNLNLYIENDIFINGTVDNISVALNRVSNVNRILLTMTKFQNHLNIKSSFIDVRVIHLNALSLNPITFCVGKGGISQVTINSIEFKFGLTTELSFQSLYLNRDFQTYLSDIDIEAFLYKYTKYLEIPNSKSHIQDQQYDTDIVIKFTDSATIHGFSNFDSVLTAIEISDNPQIFAIYFDSPDQKLLNICLTADSSDKLNDNCFLINNFTNEILQLNSGANNVLIDIYSNYEYDQLNFESFYVKNLSITAKYNSNVHFGTLNFIGNVTSNLTITNLHNLTFKITPTYEMNKHININNICIFNCSIIDLGLNGTEKIKIENFSICQFLDFPTNWEIKNLNYLSNYTNLTYIIASYDKELVYVSTFGYVNLSNYENFNIYFPFYVNQNQDRSTNEKILYMFLNTDQIPKFNIYMIDNNASLRFYKWEDIPNTFDDYYSDIQNEVSVISSSNPISFGKNENQFFSVFHFDFDVNLFYSMQLKNINITGTGHVSNYLFYRKSQTFNVDSVLVSQNIDNELSKISCEQVFLTFNGGEIYRPNKIDINISSIHEKIIHFMNYETAIQKVYLFEKINSIINEGSSPSYHILVNNIQLYLREAGTNTMSNDEDDCHFNKLFFDEISLLDGATFKGFSAEETTFRRLKCTFNNLHSLGGNIKIIEKLSLYGTIKQEKDNSKKTIKFENGNSLLKVTLDEPEQKILIGERLIIIGSFTFTGVEHAEIIINSSGFKYIIEPAEKDGLNFTLFPKVSIIQSSNSNNMFRNKLLTNEEDDNEKEETYRFINIKTTNNQNIRKGISEKIANKFKSLSKKFDLSEHSEKVSRMNSHYPSELANSIHLVGNWTGSDSRFSFHNLADVDFISDSETVPFHFVSTLGNVTIYVINEKTNFLGNFLCSNTKNSIQINILCKAISNTISNVTFCGTFGGSSEIHIRLCQPRLHVCFNRIFFKQNSLNIHSFMSIDGYSMFSILEGGSFVDRIIHLSFECTLELTDPKITEFLNEKVKIIGLYVDPSFSNRIIIGWDVFPETHGIFESFEFYFSRRARKLLYVMRQSPFDVPLSVCLSELDTCEVNIPSEDYFNDIRSFLPKGKKSILMLLSESSNSILNFNYPFFDNFSIYMIGYGIIDMTVSFGYNHVSELDLSSVSVVISDVDNYSINYVLATSGAKVKNVHGIQKLEFTDFYDFKSSKIDSFMNRLIIPSEHGQIVFQKDGIELKNTKDSLSTYQFKNSSFPDLEIKIVDSEAIFGKPSSIYKLQFLIDDDDDINDSNINKISIFFDKKTIIEIGKGWDKIHKDSIFNSIEGISNIDQIITESFPFQPFYILTNQEVNNKPISVYPNDDLFPISITTEFSLLKNESIILNISNFLFDSNNIKPNISFEDALIMNDRTKIEILDNTKQRIIKNYDDQESSNCYIEIDKLIISQDSSCSISSAQINDKIEVKMNSNFFGNLDFNSDSTVIINGGYNTYTKKLVNFPSIIFNSYPTTIPSKIIINISDVNDKNLNLNDKMASDFNLENKKYRETKAKMQILNSLETTPGVFLSNLGFLCSEWDDVVEISSTVSTLKSSCVNGYLKITNEINNTDDIIIITPNRTPIEINLSDYAHPTMTPIVNIRNKKFNTNFIQSFLGVIIVASVLLVLIAVLFIVVFNLKKKYNKLGETRDEDENNYSIHASDDVIKL